MIEFVQKTLKSKKTGKEFTAYVFAVGDYESPIFFPSKIEQQYIEEHINE